MTPNPAIDRSAQRQRRWVPVALRAPAPGHCERWTSSERARRHVEELVAAITSLLPSLEATANYVRELTAYREALRDAGQLLRSGYSQDELSALSRPDGFAAGAGDLERSADQATWGMTMEHK